MEDPDMEVDVNVEVHLDESPADKEIYSDKLTTKTDVYAYAMVVIEVCSNIHDSNCEDSVLRPRKS